MGKILYARFRKGEKGEEAKGGNENKGRCLLRLLLDSPTVWTPYLSFPFLSFPFLSFPFIFTYPSIE